MISTSTIRRDFAPALVAFALAVAVTAPALALQNEYTLRVSALMPGAKVLVDGVELKPTDESFVDPQPVEVALEGAAGFTRAAIAVPEAGVTLIVNAATIQLQVREDGGLEVALNAWGESGAWLDLYHDQDAPAVGVTVGGARVDLPRGIVRVAAQADGALLWAASGQLRVAMADNREVVLSAGAENAVAIAGGAAVGSATRAANASGEIFAAYQNVVQASLLPDLVRVAESVAEGDIEPPTRAGAVAAVAVAPAVTVREIVPRGGTVARITTGLQGALRASVAQNLAEAFLASGQAAQAVVGARLQRTRVISDAGSARSPLAVSPEVTRPFSIGRIGVGLR